MLRTLPAESVQCCVTSPPYWGLRDYGEPGQLGLEPTPEEYISKMVAIFAEVRRVLRDDGVLFLNLGDSYASDMKGSGGIKNSTLNAARDEHGWLAEDGHSQPRMKIRKLDHGLKPKDLCGIPWRVALALQADGWYLRSDIIWHKPNPMPESVTDRPTKAHEYIFLLTKSARYFWDADAVAEASTYPGDNRASRTDTRKTADPMCNDGGSRARTGKPTGNTRNIRSVWTIATRPLKEAHFACFPPEIPEKCIKAGSSEKGCCPECGTPWVRLVERTAMKVRPSESRAETDAQGLRTQARGTMTEAPTSRTVGWGADCKCSEAKPVPCIVIDPFMGAGTVAMVAESLNRSWIGIELNPEYVEMIKRRVSGPLFAGEVSQ